MIDLSIPPAAQPHLIGHTFLWDNFCALVTDQRLPPAILLEGAEGIGKATLAYHFAKYLFETSIPTLSKSIIESQVANKSFPNLYVLSPQEGKDIPIDTVRAVIQQLHHSPFYDGWRVVIIDPVTQLGLQAAQALLKIVEEPPAQTLFILIAPDGGDVLPTLRSRCLHMPVSIPALPASLPLAISSDILVLTHNRLGLAWQWDKKNILALYQHLGSGLEALCTQKHTVLTKIIETVVDDEAWHSHHLPTLMLALYRILGAQTWTSFESDLFPRLLAAWPREKWLEAQHALAHLSLLADHAHLDRKHLLFGAYFVLEHPYDILY